MAQVSDTEQNLNNFIEWSKKNIEPDKDKKLIDHNNDILSKILKDFKIFDNISEIHIQTFTRNSSQKYISEKNWILINIGEKELYDIKKDKVSTRKGILMNKNSYIPIDIDNEIIVYRDNSKRCRDNKNEYKKPFIRPRNYFRICLIAKIKIIEKEIYAEPPPPLFLRDENEELDYYLEEPDDY